MMISRLRSPTIRAARATRPPAPSAGFASRSWNTIGSLCTPTEEVASLRATVRAFAEAEVAPAAAAADAGERFNRPLFNRLGKLGLLGLTAPVEHGGSGCGAVAVVAAHEELAAVDPGFTLSYLAHSLLFVNNLAVNGSPAQMAAYLPDACSGATLCGMAMSEPGAGTDVLGMATTAKKQGDGWVLNGSKMWITNGYQEGANGGPPVTGDAFLVYARTGGPPGPKGAYSLFLVDKGAPGFSLGGRITGKCGMRASSTASLVFDQVALPPFALVGGEGTAIKSMMRNLEIERLGLAAMSLGIARRAIQVMAGYASTRVAFGSPINRFGQIQDHIATSYAEYAAGRAYVYSTAASLSLGGGGGSDAGGRLDSDGVKLYCAQMATTVAGRAMSVLGGNGYVSEYVVERLWRDAKLLEIGGGTLESHQKNMTKDLAKFDQW